jgi:hypothetical protein
MLNKRKEDGRRKEAKGSLSFFLSHSPLPRSFLPLASLLLLYSSPFASHSRERTASSPVVSLCLRELAFEQAKRSIHILTYIYIYSYIKIDRVILAG